MSPHQLNSKNNSPVLFFKTIIFFVGIETVSGRPLLRMSRMDVD